MRATDLALVVAALCVVPVLAFDAGGSGARTENAAVVSDAASFAQVTNHGPSSASRILLVVANDYEADALTVKNQYTANVAFHATIVHDPTGRFVLANADFVLAPGAQATVKVQDDSEQHFRGCFTLVVRLDGNVGGDGALRTGHFRIDRTLHTQVKSVC